MADAVKLSGTASSVPDIGRTPSRPQGEVQSLIHLSIVSNSCLLRDGVAMLLGQHLSFELVGTYLGECPDAADLPSPKDHIVLLDDNIGRAATLSWLCYWRSRVPPVTVLILDLADDPEKIIEYIEHGASGYTLQQATAAEVAAAVLQLHNGSFSCSPQVMSHVFARLAHLHTQLDKRNGGPPLTGREMEVLRALANQMTNRQIAERLVIEVRTVKHHVHNILEKLNRSSRHDAVRRAREMGWLSDEPLNRSN